MSISANPYSNYRQSHVETADQTELLVMMYNGALKFLRQGRQAIGDKNIENTNYFLGRVQDIIAELMGSLDLENGGEVAKNLFNIYEYMHHRLVQANIKKDAALLVDVEKMLASLKQAWEQNRQETPAQVNTQRDKGILNYGC